MRATVVVLAALQALLFVFLCSLFPQSSDALRLLLEDSPTGPVISALGSAISILALMLFGATLPATAALALFGVRYSPSRHGLLAPTMLGLAFSIAVQGFLGRSSAPRWIMSVVVASTFVLALSVPRVAQVLRGLAREIAQRLPMWMALGVGVEILLVVFGRRMLVNLPFYDDVFRTQFVVQWLSFKPFTNFLNFGGADLRYYSLLELLSAFHARVLGLDFKQTYLLGVPLSLHFLFGAVITSSTQVLTKRRVPIWFVLVVPSLMVLLSATYTQMQAHLFVRESQAGLVLVVLSLAAFARAARTKRPLDFVACCLTLMLLIGIKASLGLIIVAMCAGLSLFLPLAWQMRIATSLGLFIVPISFYRWFVQIRMATTAELAPMRNVLRSGLYKWDVLFALSEPALSDQIDRVQAIAAEALRLHIVFIPVLFELVRSLRNPRATLRRQRLPWLLAAASFGFFMVWSTISIQQETGSAESYWNIGGQYVASALTILWLARAAIAPLGRVQPWLRPAALAVGVWATAIGVVGIIHANNRDLLWCPVDAPLIRSLREIRRLTSPKTAVLHNIYGDALENFVTVVSERQHAFSYAYDGASVPWDDKVQRKQALDMWWQGFMMGGSSTPPPLNPRPRKIVLLARGADATPRPRYKLIYSDPPYTVWVPQRR